MAEKKKYKPAYPHGVLGARQGEWPEIGPGPTELSATEFEKANAFAESVGMRLEEIEDRQAVDSTGHPVDPKLAEPRPSDSTQVWREYAEALNVPVPDGASRAQIQELVASAKNGE